MVHPLIHRRRRVKLPRAQRRNVIVVIMVSAKRRYRLSRVMQRCDYHNDRAMGAALWTSVRMGVCRAGTDHNVIR